MIQSASAMTSRLCSIRTMLLPDEAVQDVNELFDVGHVQADGGFVEYVERVLVLAAAAGP